MKIGIDISQIVYTGTGVSTYTQNLVRSLIELQEKNDFVLFGSSLRRQEDLWRFIRSLHNKSTLHARVFSFPLTFLEIIWNKIHMFPIEYLVGKMDVFHTSDWIEPPGKRKVTTIHDLVVYKYPQFLNKRIVETQLSKLKWVKKESRAIIADSESTKKDIMEYLKISEKKIHVVYLGTGKEYYPRPQDEIARVRKKYNLSDRYILSVGTREPRKNLRLVIAAFKLLKQQDVQLVIAGKFGWGEDIEPVTNALILDLVPDSDLAALYSGAACFVYPSLYEGFGLPILEAMSSGCPVVTSDRGSLQEISKNIALTADPESPSQIAESIKSILDLPKNKRQSFIQKGLMHARQFTWQKTAQKTLKVYQSIT